MNYKDLVNALAREAGVSGGGNISTVSSTTGETARLAYWIKQADLDIQGMYFDWKFLWTPFGFSTEAGKPEYAAPLERHWWDRDKARIGDAPVADITEYELWDGIESQDEDAPHRIILMPNGNLKLLPTPDGAYSVSLPFYRSPKPMAVDTDVSLIPDPFHDLIWMRALLKYAFYEAAPEVLERVSTEWPDRLQALQSHQLPNQYRNHLAQDADPIVVRPE